MLEPARAPRAPSQATLDRLAALHVRISPIEIDGATRHHAELDQLPPAGIGELVDALAEVETLRSVDLSDTELDSLDEVGRLTRLVRLDVSGNPVDQLWPLRRMKALAELDLSRTRVLDLDHVDELLGLTRLRAVGTELDDIQGLRDLGQLRSLDLEETLVDADDPVLESLRARLPGLRVRL